VSAAEFLASARAALGAWSLDGARLAPLGTGLINRTYLVEAGDARFVLQRVNVIFDARIHENIAAVTARLRERGLATLTLVPTTDDRLWIEDGGVYRLYRHVDGASFDVVRSLTQARSAGRHVGAFHAALTGLPHRFVGMRLGVHDTARHLDVLRWAVDERGEHRLHSEVRPLAADVLAAAEALAPLPSLAPILGHGDLKLSNLLFSRERHDEALCLVDLDTVGPIELGHELGDMWRSWCNRATEDAPEARLDLEVMRSSFDGYVEGLGRTPSLDERHSALLGPEWVALELSARFAADALVESYFGWDPSRYATRGDHNLARARGQWALHTALRASRRDRERLLGLGT
jgi:Ser/Thr protein kinase RdoA (MazF antagonist)